MIVQVVTLAALVLMTAASAATALEQPRMGGVLEAGLIGEAPTLDLHATTAAGARQMEDVGFKVDLQVVDTVDVTRRDGRGYKPGPYLDVWNSWIAT